MKTPAENAKEICDAIGKRINAIRKEKKMTLDHLADKTGFAKSYLSQIENMKREPPISTLAKIAYVLNVDVIYLLSGEIRQEDQNFSLVKPSERKIFHRSFGDFGYIYESLNFKKADRLMDGFIITTGFEFPPEPMTHEGQELAYVLEGQHEFFYDGQIYEVGEGDSFYFNSSKPHYSRSIGDKRGKILVVFAARK
jgi:transcriptional regulator with XRE-family HTH domain